MHILRKLALGLLSSLFVFLLFATAFDVGFTRTATHPATVKKLVADSGIYNSIVPNLLKQSGNISTPLGNILATDPAVLQAAQQVVSPQNVQKQTEAAIDSVYQWLNGQVSQPQFTIGLAANNGSFADSVSSAVGQRLAGLPACSAAQDLAIAHSGSFDVINASCRPLGVSGATVGGVVKAAIAANPDFFNQASITSSDIKGGDSGQPIFQQAGLKNLPKQYQRAKKTPMILIILTLLTGTGIVFLSRNWQAGLRHIGINLLVVGLIMLVFSWALNRTVNKNLIPKIKVDNAVLQTDVRRLASDIAQQIDKNYWFFGGIYTVLGAAAIAGGHIALRKRSAASQLDKIDIDPPPHPKRAT